MLVLGIPPAIMALIGLLRKSGPLLSRIEPPWLANGSRGTRRVFYGFVMSVVVCLIAGSVPRDRMAVPMSSLLAAERRPAGAGPGLV